MEAGLKTIRQLRVERGMTQQQLASALDVTLATIGNWERDIFEPKASQLRAVARLFEVSMDEIAIPTVDVVSPGEGE